MMWSAFWNVVSKATKFWLPLIDAGKYCFNASWHERPGSNPYELWVQNCASHSASCRLTTACKARSYIMGTLQSDRCQCKLFSAGRAAKNKATRITVRSWRKASKLFRGSAPRKLGKELQPSKKTAENTSQRNRNIGSVNKQNCYWFSNSY